MFKRKSLTERWDDNYAGIPVPANNRRGFKIKYVYYAPWYIWNLPEEELKKKKQTILLASVCGFVLYLAFAFLHTPLNSKLFVVVPGIVALCLHILELVGEIRFFTAGYRTTRMNYEDVENAMRLWPRLRCYLLAFASAAGVIYLPFKCFSLLSLLVIAGNAVCAALAWFVHKTFEPLTTITEKNTTLDTMERLDTFEFNFPGLDKNRKKEDEE